MFVDDDNEALPDVPRRGHRAILDGDPTLGCVGGAQLCPIALPRWLAPLRHYLGIRDDLGDAPFSELADAGLALPPTAGMVVRRAIAERFLDHARWFDALGRHGERGLGSCEDLLLARGARPLGLACGYRPEPCCTTTWTRAGCTLALSPALFFGQGASEACVVAALGPPRGAAHRDRLRRGRCAIRARSRVSSRARPAGSASEVGIADGVGRAVHRDRAVREPHDACTSGAAHRSRATPSRSWSPRRATLDAREALRLERVIADREHLVDQA